MLFRSEKNPHLREGYNLLRGELFADYLRPVEKENGEIEMQSLSLDKKKTTPLEDGIWLTEKFHMLKEQFNKPLPSMYTIDISMRLFEYAKIPRTVAEKKKKKHHLSPLFSNFLIPTRKNGRIKMILASSCNQKTELLKESVKSCRDFHLLKKLNGGSLPSAYKIEIFMKLVEHWPISLETERKKRKREKRNLI